jgi:hypothetical protein
MAHRGPTEFVRSRFLRLGVPWLAFMLLIWPFFMWLAYRAAGHPVSFWQAFRGRTPFLDSGPLWFVQVLLYISVGYAIWAWKRPTRPEGVGTSLPGNEHNPAPTSARGHHLAIAALAIALASFLVRLEFPARSQQVLDLHLWQWPQCIGMFCLGVVLSGQGWARVVPAGVARRCGIAVIVTPLVGFLLALAVGVRNLATDGAPFLGGWHWQSLTLALVEATLVVAGSVWLLSWAQRHLAAKAPIMAAVDRGAYAAYMLQVPVLLSLEIAARPLPLPALAKALLVGCLAVAASFWLGWAIAERTRLGRVL